ncbi:RNA-binding region-containing protein 3-like [Nymphalis io]|uniref:RNA-binding region-containing protein 3-like n=1 Tax=Inachis io TaxID=171585 RepID=UPI0021681790|nr:RNA-binding region-containing protein 3-like [Nymphalis io]
MSKVLIIRHLPEGLSFEDKEKLLKHFGAIKIWEKVKKRNYIFASFSTVEKAKSCLQRLHMLEIAQRRLVVEYSFEKEPVTETKRKDDTNSTITNQIKEFLRIINAWNPSLDFYQPPPVHLRYSYPKVSPQIIVNIMYELFVHKPFYTQTLHLMNKMSLKTPFKENETAINFFKENFRDYFIEEMSILPPSEPSDPESEISSDDEIPKQLLPSMTKRKHTLPKTRKRPAAVLSTALLPKQKTVKLNQEEVFDVVTPVIEAKKISLVVSQDALQKQCENEPEVVGELGKFQKEDQPSDVQQIAEEHEQPPITKQEILANRISNSDMKILPVFKNYHPGEPSMRLYIKNLAKTVTEQDVKRIYKRYLQHIPEEEQLGFDVRVMQEGRMKGQAFVTFPSVKIAEEALNETNGYLLKEKPMVVQFARAATKKTIE